MPPRRIAGWLFLLLLCVYLLSLGGTPYSADGHFGFEMAKSLLLDPAHSYFHRFRSGFIRWGMLSPVLAQPLVLAGEVVARQAPQRDELVVNGHHYRLEVWPIVGPPNGGDRQRSFQVALPQTVSVSEVHLISFLSNAAAVPDGASVASVRLTGAGQPIAELALQAGRDTAEWAWERPDVRQRVAHAKAPIAGQWIGQPLGRYYYAVLPVAPAVPRTGLSVAFTGSVGTLHVMSLAVRDATTGAVIDVRNGKRIWSQRQNRDIFLRLAYAVLPALATAAAGVLVYALVRTLGYVAPVAVLTALGYGLGTMAWPYAKLDFTEPPATAFVLLATLLLTLAWRRALDGPGLPNRGESGSAVRAQHAAPLQASPVLLAGLAGVSCIAAIATKYVTACFVPLLLMHGLLLATGLPSGRRLGAAVRLLGAFLLPILALGIVALAASVVVAGGPPVLLTEFIGGLQRGWLGLPPWIGFRGLVFSPGKSLFLYSPFLILGLVSIPLFVRRHGWRGALYVVVPVLFIAIYSLKRVWDGGGWGPRYMVPMVPFLAIVAAPLIAAAWRHVPSTRQRRTILWKSVVRCWRRWLLLSFLLLAALVQVLGVAKDFNLFASMYRQHLYPQLPDAGASLGGWDYLEFLDGPGLRRAPQTPFKARTDTPARDIGYLYGVGRLDMEITFRERRTTWLSLYTVDFNRQSRRQTIVLRDSRGERRYRQHDPFEEGVWLGWQVEGSPEQPVEITVIQEGHDVAVLSALTFDPLPVDGRWTDVPKTDQATQGRWRGRYGREGFVLFAWRGDHSDAVQLPPYIAGYSGGERVNIVTTEGSVAEAGLLYAPPFSPLLNHAWLLSADAVRIVWPGRLDLLQRVLAAPPWRWWGLNLQLSHPEFGLGLNLWPAQLYGDYGSHDRLLAAVIALLVVIEGGLVLAALGLLRALRAASSARGWLRGWPPWITVGGLALVLAVYNVAQFRWG